MQRIHDVRTRQTTQLKLANNLNHKFINNGGGWEKWVKVIKRYKLQS